MIEEMQEQEAEFLKEQKEKKLKNRRLSAFLETFHSMFKLPKFQRCCYITVVHLFQGAFFLTEQAKNMTLDGAHALFPAILHWQRDLA